MGAALAAAGAASADVEILGVEGAVADNVLAYLDLDEEACDAPRSRIEQLYGRAPPRIRESLQAFGYYEPSVTPELTFDEACWHARFTIAAGEPVRIRTLQLGLTGAAETDPPFVTAFAEAGLKVGDQITAVDGEAIGTAPEGEPALDPVTLDARLGAIASRGESVVLTVNRGGELVELSMAPRVVTWQSMAVTENAPLTLDTIGAAAELRA